MRFTFSLIRLNYIAVMISIAILSLLLSVQGCKHYPDDVPSVNPINTDTSNNGQDSLRPCDPDSVYFQNTILPIITSSCAYSGCHDAASSQDGIILDNYLNIINYGEIKAGDPTDSKLYEVITETRSDKIMPPPPNSPLTTQQIALINKWISQGAPNNKCNECDSTNIQYSKQVVSILNNNCVTCHNASSANGGVKLDSYAEVKLQVDNGKLLGTMSHSNGFKPMPSSGNKISDCNIIIVKKWIDNGALNN